MAKKTEFSWDTEEMIGTIQEGPKVEHDIKVCTKGETTFVVATKRVLKKDGWAIEKNQTFKQHVFDQLLEMFQNK